MNEFATKLLRDMSKAGQVKVVEDSKGNIAAVYATEEAATQLIAKRVECRDYSKRNKQQEEFLGEHRFFVPIRSRDMFQDGTLLGYIMGDERNLKKALKHAPRFEINPSQSIQR